MLKRIALAICALTVLLVTSACGLTSLLFGNDATAPPKPTVPTNAAQLTQVPPGKALSLAGYTPAVALYDDDKLAGKQVTGTLWLKCPTNNITNCASDFGSIPTNEKPAIIVHSSPAGYRVTSLIGGHDSGYDAWHYHVSVPQSMQDWSTLDEKSQFDIMKNLMPKVADAMEPGTVTPNVHKSVKIDGYGMLDCWDGTPV